MPYQANRLQNSSTVSLFIVLLAWLLSCVQINQAYSQEKDTIESTKNNELPRDSNAPESKPEQVPTLSAEEIEKFLEEGDRLADQSQYLPAVEKYTQAYMNLVSSIRGQKFMRLVKPSLMNREELKVEMKKQFAMDYTPEELRLLDASYKGLGLAKDSFDIPSNLIQLMTEEIGGFYDPRNQAMVLVQESKSAKKAGILGWLSGDTPEFDKDEQKATLAHELTHALQDQLYGLKTMQDSIEKDDDMLLAFSALVEGDATVLMFSEMSAEEGELAAMDLDPKNVAMMMSVIKMSMPLASGNAFRNSPPIIRESLLFPYLQGMVFVLNIMKERKFDTVHRIYTDPPSSTEQILHPETFLKTRDVPQSINIENTSELLGKDWKHLGGNVLGEYQMSIMLDYVDLEKVAAVGWDGDRYEVYAGPNDRLAILWASTWDSEKDADEFVRVYEKYLTRMKRLQSNSLDELTANGKAIETDGIFSTSRWTAAIHKNGMDVVIVQGLPEEQGKQLLETMKPITKTEKPFPKKK